MKSYDYFLASLKNWNNFSGRSSRTEYWVWFLYTVLIVMGVFSVNIILGLYVWLFVFLLTLPLISRRLHDTNSSFLWAFIFVIPFVNQIFWLLLGIVPARKENNIYGQRIIEGVWDRNTKLIEIAIFLVISLCLSIYISDSFADKISEIYNAGQQATF